MIQSFKKILESDRHNNQVLYILGSGILIDKLNYEKNYTIKHDVKAPGHKRIKNIKITLEVQEI